MVIAQLFSANKIYKSGDTIVTAMDKTSLEVRTGEVLLILGPSGSGKTTLLSLIGCVIYPTEGKVSVNGQEVNKLSDVELAALRLKNIGFVFQSFNLFAPLNAEENVGFPLTLDGQLSRKEIRKKAHEALKKVGLYEKRKSRPQQLSGGQQQRVAIARALVTNPTMLLCDEPTAALDAATFLKIMNELRTLAKQGKAVVIVTHNQKLEAFADRIVHVDMGRVLEN
ncbi:MAG: ABC transporter ATP-binding protein [Saprospiraceae bacterium]|jgi:putative ABC transport system ATP-binding protein|nr:ABC transporter ATP-binding protein [Saprospiraceae bacterium]